MGLRLTYHLTSIDARSSSPALLAALLTVLNELRLLSNDASLPRLAQHPTAPVARAVTSAELDRHLKATTDTDVVVVSGLRTVDRFPNLFGDYTIDERSMEASLTLRWSRQQDTVQLELSDVGLSDDDPLVPAASLLRLLETVTRSAWVPACTHDGGYT